MGYEPELIGAVEITLDESSVTQGKHPDLQISFFLIELFKKC